MVEIGAVYVGPKDAIGAVVQHWQYGGGHVLAIAKDGAVVDFYSHGGVKHFAAAFAQQTPKLIKTNSELGQTCIANVKAVGSKVVNKDDGKTIGYVGSHSQNGWYFQHTPDSYTSSIGFGSKHLAIKALVKYVNEYAVKQSTPLKTFAQAYMSDKTAKSTLNNLIMELGGSKKQLPADPWAQTLGKAPELPDILQPTPVIDASIPTLTNEEYKTVKKDVSGDQLKGGPPTKDADDKIIGGDILYGKIKLGFTLSNGDGTMRVFHADGTLVHEKAIPGQGQATNAIAQHHNLHYGNDAELLAKVNAMLKAELTEGKFTPTVLSQSLGGLHNMPELDYTVPPEEHRNVHFKIQPCADVASEIYSSIPGAHLLKLTVQEKSSVRYYTGDGYVELNNALREGMITNGKVAEHMERIDKAFHKTPELEKTIVVYRGIDPSAAIKLMGDIGSHVGKTFTEPGYSSCSAYPSGMFVGGVVMRVTVPKGSHVLKPSQVGKYDDNEYEVIVPRGAQFKVMFDGKIGHKRQIDLVLIGSALN